MLKYLIEKEYKQIIRNRSIPRMIVSMLLMMMLVMPWVANQEINDVRVSIVDNDRSSISNRLVQKISASSYFKLTDLSPSGTEAMQRIESGKANIILEISPDFEKDFITGKTSRVMISANAVNGTKGILGITYLSSILNDYSGELRNEYGKYVRTTTVAKIPTFDIMSQYRFNPHLDYKVFMVPALMVMLLTMLTGFLPALNIVSEKETGTIEQINVTPTKKSAFILAKLIPFWIIGFIVLSLCMGLAAAVYHIFPAGNLFTIYLFTMIFIITMSGFGLIISNYSETMSQAMLVMYFFMLIFILMSGLFTPVASMPGWAQMIAAANPLKYFIEVMRLVYLKGSSFTELTMQFFVLCGFAAIFYVWAVWSYKKR